MRTITVIAVVHIAGEVKNGLQRCARCGEILIDYRGKAVMVPAGEASGLSFWPAGRLVGTDGRASYMLPERPLDADEAHCSTARVQ